MLPLSCFASLPSMKALIALSRMSPNLNNNKTMNTDITKRLESIETLLLAIVPWHKLTVTQKEKLGPIMERNAPETMGDKEERKKFVKREFLKLINLSSAKRKTAKFPQALIPQNEAHMIHPCVPLSILVNRCRARKVFAPTCGEDSAVQNVIDAITECGFIQNTLGDLGIHRFSDVCVVLTKDARTKINPVMFPDDEEEEEEEETIQADLDRMKAEREAMDLWGNDEEPKGFNWSSINKEEELETAEDDDDDDDDLLEADKEPENLTTTTDLVDDGWGPDEVEFDNPVREQFEAEAEAAWQREQALLETGELVIVDGIPVARKSTLKK
jgi:hypothetical protein